MTHRCADIPLCQMVARVAKNIIRAMLREKMKELKVPSSEPYRQLVLTLLNLFSGHSDKAHEFWTSNKAPPIDEKAIRVGSTHPFLFLRFRSLTSPPPHQCSDELQFAKLWSNCRAGWSTTSTSRRGVRRRREEWTCLSPRWAATRSR
jgi:hypothetical protein